ncbi:Solute carrier organic anion transporter family member 3A1 [Heterocephalus glaber]|uniref:Solute carrier organic anion transporter family member 3A1 n=1 Tax=Heterocephalus glaber TaxID=10181 RepID=G5B7F7_HETGA|nr:Solute carrier organic anion transporter family member 3A1 [Heterocephalus glaber]
MGGKKALCLQGKACQSMNPKRTSMIQVTVQDTGTPGDASGDLPSHTDLPAWNWSCDLTQPVRTARDYQCSAWAPSQVSVLTTLERRFNLQSADVGVIASSFEIGNLALILFVSYFGARGHRPRLIGCGGIVMALGALLSALPEFLTHQYKYEAGEIRWGAEGRDVCAANGSGGNEGPDPDLICRNRTATNMMYLLLIGAQVLLGIGATPVQPLGVSYIDDHVRRKDSSLYIASTNEAHCAQCGRQQVALHIATTPEQLLNIHEPGQTHPSGETLLQKFQ